MTSVRARPHWRPSSSASALYSLLQLVAPADADDGNQHQVFAMFDAKAGVFER